MGGLLKLLYLSVFLFSGFKVSADELPSYVGVWKYSGSNFDSVSFLDLIPDHEGGLKRTSSIHIDINNNQLSGPWISRSGGLQNNVDYNRPNPIADEMRSNGGKFGSGECALPMLNQLFALDAMVNRKFISPSEKTELLKASSKLDPNQLTFIETIRTFEKDELIAKYGSIPTHARLNGNLNLFKHDKTGKIINEDEKNFYDYYAAYYDGEVQDPLDHYSPLEHYDSKTSTAILVSGQTPGKTHSLPLQTDLINKIDRNQFPHIWEIGRFAQLEASDVKWTLEAITLQIKSELAMTGGKTEDAYIFANSTDPIHTKLYEAKYGMKEFSKFKTNDAERVLVTKLSDLEKKLDLKNKLDNQSINIEALKNNLKSLNTSSISLPYRNLYFRNFEKEKSGIEFTNHEMITAEKGAHHPEVNQLAHRDFRYDNLEGRMRDYYPNNKSLGHLNDSYYLRSRMNDLKAISFDGINNFHQTAKNFDQHLAAYFELQKQFPKKFKNENIAFSIYGVINPDLGKTLEPFHLQEENVFWDPVISHNVRTSPFFNHSYQSGGGRVSLHWMSLEDAKKYMNSKPEYFRKIIKNLKNELTPAKLDEGRWREPLSGT